MFRRYLLPCTIVMAGAIAVALLVYAVTPATYQSSCVFRVGRPVFSFNSSDSLLVAQHVATTEVTRSAQGPAYTAAAQSLGGGVGADTLRHETTVVPPTIDQVDYTVSVQDATSGNAKRYADAVCSGFVSDVVQRRATDVTTYANALSANVADLRKQIAQIQAKPKDQQTQVDVTTVAADGAAVNQLQGQLAATLAQPPELVDVVNSASLPTRSDNRNLGRDLLVGVVAGVLAAFVIILVGEMVLDRRRDTQLRGLGLSAPAEQRTYSER